MTVPFMERFFGLAKHGTDTQPAGWTGQITSNSFMKREFGTKLIEEYLVRQDLRAVIDTSGAYIPGHGTPTVILIGKHQQPRTETVRAVLGVQGEPGRPENPAAGKVWRSIIDNLEAPGHDGQWVTVVDLPRDRLSTHPWSLSGGGVSEVAKRIEGSSKASLGQRVSGQIGGAIRAGADEAFMRPIGWRPRNEKTVAALRPFVMGDNLRDWVSTLDTQLIFPYEYGTKKVIDDGIRQELWPWRATLVSRSTFQGNMADAGLSWWEYMQYTLAPYRSPLSITFAFVATHNHFVLDRGGKVFNRSAPVIKLPEGATEEEHLALLGVLNSSTACFWLKQNSYPKGGDPVGKDGARVSQQPWSDRYEFTGTTLQDFPLPSVLPLKRGSQLDSLAQSLAVSTPAALVMDGTPTASAIEEAHKQSQSILGQMVAAQEELDWETYRLYGLTDEDLTYHGEDLPELVLGQRTSEIVLARQLAAGESTSTWFQRHGSTPITFLPEEWPEAYRDLVQRRLDIIESNPNIRLLEKPEYKRRWATEPWEKQEERALRTWLLNRLEDRSYWFDAQGRPAARSISQLADMVTRDTDLVGVLALWDGTVDVDVVKALTRLLTDEAVPYLAAQRLKEPG
ncbi:BREX-2 system adenine-specific DNA-methyltransferase PglX, partial [Arthrobacter sp. zg-Y809]|nr:BREX-2 system adenine-specific DNA-methyltransferase PglX [Arthrobacter gengyunqii]